MSSADTATHGLRPTPGPTASWGQRAALENILECQGGMPFLPDANGRGFRPVKDTLYDGTDKDPTMKVAIVGAGCAGLFTAMLFDYLRAEFGVKVDYEILEAVDDDKPNEKKQVNGTEPKPRSKASQRKGVGGRLYTHYFEDKDTQEGLPSRQYYDVSGMRFPKNPMMARTFQLFEHLKMTEADVKTAKKGQLVPYILDGDITPLLYNGKQFFQKTVDDPKNPGKKAKSPLCTAEAFEITGLPRGIMRRNPGTMVTDSIEPYRAARINHGTQAFWDDLMRKGDRYSVRQYLQLVENYDYNTIEFLETMNFGNRWYDQAFSEMVVDDLEFGYDDETKWWCVMGGAQQLCYKMQNELKKPDTIKFGKIVDEIKYPLSEKELEEGIDGEKYQNLKVEVTVRDEKESRTYDAVFNSAALGAQGHMKLEGLSLNWGTKQAIRSLGYGASCKVGIRFRSLWWIKKYRIVGGIGRSDLPSGFCVYPSYNTEHAKDEAKLDKPGVLLVSYTWSQQAEKLGSLINDNDEDELKKLLLHCLARLHTNTEADYKSLLSQLENEYMEHYAYNWYEDPYTAGAFAFFGPSQFQNMWQWITRTNGKYVIIGEAASSHHAWVVGSLESAVRGVYQFLWAHSLHWKAASQALLSFVGKGPSDKPDLSKSPVFDKKTQSFGSHPWGPVPEEFNRTDAADYPKDATTYPDCSPIAELARQQVAIEMMRLELGGDMLKSGKVTAGVGGRYYGKAASSK